jgi:FkbM family methyltransferase
MKIRRLIKAAAFAASPAVARRCVRVVQTCRAYRQARSYASPTLSSESVAVVTPEWRERIDDVKNAHDNAYIARGPNAGVLKDGWITMHNGIEVSALGYYGAGVLNMLIENRGVHEPEEERAFGEVLKNVDKNSTMLELGAYWGFYSLWFKKSISGSRCFLIEPDLANLKSGQANFARNAEEAVFDHAYIGSSSTVTADGVKVVSVDSFCDERAIDTLAILHADIQGSEVEMLRGASRMLREQRIDFIFISTHSNELHADCTKLLESYHYQILADANLNETYSYDGVIVAKSAQRIEPERLTINRKTAGLTRAE